MADKERLIRETIDYVRKAIDALNHGHAVSATPATMRVLARARAILEQLVYEHENEAEEQEFPVYVGWDGQEHGEY